LLSSPEHVYVAKSIGADKTREENTLAQAIGAELTDLRQGKGWSQQKLADRLGYDVSHVRQTEMGGNPTLEFLAAVATLFALQLSEFIQRAEKRLGQNRFQRYKSGTIIPE
jgi:transcriptional regulator with XRE-family HTH domain